MIGAVATSAATALGLSPKSPKSPKNGATSPVRPSRIELTGLEDPYWTSKPPGDGPVDVFVSLLVKDVGEVDVTQGKFYMSIGMKIMWRDPRIALPDINGIPDELWTPDVMLPNSTDNAQDDAGVTISHKDSGLLSIHRNLQGHFSCPFNLENFPFDENTLKVRFNASRLGDGRSTNAEHVILRAGTQVGPGIEKAAPFLLVSKNIQVPPSTP